MRALGLYEGMASDLNPLREDILAYTTSPAGSHGTAMEAYYFARHCFLKPQQIRDHMSVIQHIPTVILQGQNDMICPPAGAYNLHAALPQSTLHIVPACGHRATPAMEALRVAVLDALIGP